MIYRGGVVEVKNYLITRVNPDFESDTPTINTHVKVVILFYCLPYGVTQWIFSFTSGKVWC